MGALASAWGAEVITKIFSMEKLKRRLSCLKKKKKNLQKHKTWEPRFYADSKLAGSFWQINPPTEDTTTPKPFSASHEMPVYMEHRKDRVLTPRNIQSKAPKALSGCRTFSLCLSISLSVFLLVETPSFYLALWDTKKSFIMECRFPVIPRVSSSLSRSPVKSASRDWCPRVCVGILLWFALYISILFYLYI